MSVKDYDIELDELRLDMDEVNRDNYIALSNSLAMIQEILLDIKARLEALE